jgi:hypothetical protein
MVTIAAGVVLGLIAWKVLCFFAEEPNMILVALGVIAFFGAWAGLAWWIWHLCIAR